MDIQIQQNVSLKQFCSYRTGGNARFFATASNWEMFYHLREFAKDQNIPYVILGSGSNVLFLDEGYPGLVILNRMGTIHFEGETVIAEGGANLMKVLLIAAEHNLGGISGLANVPGTVGGAVYGNAGIPDLWMSNVLLEATLLQSAGSKPITVPPDYFQFGYRMSRLKQTHDIVLSAKLQLKPMPKAVVRMEIDQYIKARALKQPAGFSCGSFFKNPKEFPSAGWLIEQSGCKGMAVGGAVVSPKHANFMMNTGTATSTDILNLTLQVHRKVKEKFDISLEPEVQILPVNPFNEGVREYN